MESAPQADETPPTELVPDVSLDEYIQKFRYEPPTDSGEVTMRMDAAPMIESGAAGRSGRAGFCRSAEALPVVDVHVPRDRSSGGNQVNASPMPSDAVAADSVASRLGLEPETAAEERIERPRFLDVNEAPVTSLPKKSGPSQMRQHLRDHRRARPPLLAHRSWD